MKKSKAEDRTVGIFSRKTREEEAADAEAEEAELAKRPYSPPIPQTECFKFLSHSMGVDGEVNLAYAEDGRTVIQVIRKAPSGAYVARSEMILTSQQVDALTHLLTEK